MRRRSRPSTPSLRGLFWETTSSEVIELVMEKVSRALDDPDPFASEKDRQNKVVMALYPRLKALVEKSENPLYTATKLAILGNAIDFMVPQNTADIEKSINDKLDFTLDQHEYEKLSLISRWINTNTKNSRKTSARASGFFISRTIAARSFSTGCSWRPYKDSLT